MNNLKKIKEHTYVVGDTSNKEVIKKFNLEESTTNPTIILQRIKNNKNTTIKPNLLQQIKKNPEEAADIFNVAAGIDLVHNIAGRVSTEINPEYSFDTKKSVESARKIIDLYEANNISRDRIYIKIAATWEGACAAEILEKENIQCNLTLIFNLVQARACAEKNISLISPFVGRILDWHKQNNSAELQKMQQDPGVKSVTEIYNYLKQYGYKTEVMAASFRNIEQIINLCGCDKMTINEKLLHELEASNSEIKKVIFKPTKVRPKPTKITESEFRWNMQQDKMANEKLQEGISKFTIDYKNLAEQVKDFASQR